MDSRKPAGRKPVAVPLILGIASVLSLVLYAYSMNHKLYACVGILFAAPICALIGLVFSIVTRKSRKVRPLLWFGGLALCLLGLVVSLLVMGAWLYLMGALLDGTWRSWL